MLKNSTVIKKKKTKKNSNNNHCVHTKIKITIDTQFKQQIRQIFFIYYDYNIDQSTIKLFHMHQKNLEN